ncbi:hypothetical protein MO867_19570 [Microbulbifer sp. OS29]|uniref:Uncharacterized protein n=1 Tax=Microbulbifer okhotskensis TaxID=2926617 RepID=A0A9X2ERL5_9GAMM|nr:hypothetical protein [Microbulbifer okhotskensis]MCO1336536.1 hypothetical protein [Microbulbifer okhotskensis]
MPMASHIQQLHHVTNLCAGLEWVADCPNQLTRKALLQLIGEEVEFLLQGVIFAYEQKTPGGSPAIEEAA